MSRWFRHYAGMMRDEKLVSAAIRSKQPVERVVWVWGALLESASEVNDGGRYDFDAGEAAYFLRVDESDITDILTALVSLGRISESAVVRWSDRQFESDQSKDRQKRYRERQKASRDGGVTSRDGEVTAQETETYTEVDGSSLRSEPIQKKREAEIDPEEKAFRSWFSSWPTFTTDDEDKARTSWHALSPVERRTVTANTPGYITTVKASKRDTWHAADKYLSKRLWERVKGRPPPPQTREEYLAAEKRRSERSFQ
jgi:hypothetical protein